MASKNETMIAALLRERNGYERRGLHDRVRQVDEQLKHHGHKPERATKGGPQGRTASPQQTADAGTGAGVEDTAAKQAAAKSTAAKKTAAAAPPAPPAE